MEVTKSIRYVGVNDHQIDLFEGQYVVPNGMSYNSYVILDDKVAVMDTVDQHFTAEWMQNLDRELNGRKPDYLVVQHMEPDHSANVAVFMDRYPDAVVVSSEKAFAMMTGFFGTDYENRQMVVKEGDSLELGSHSLMFVEAPMVHWPEVLMTYDTADKVLFSADGFGKFGALDVDEPWDDEARRYYIGIVGKYGDQVQNVLKKAASLEIEIIAPLHGPVLKEDLGHYLNLYDIWSAYRIEEDGVVVAYTSVYGHTRKAVEDFAEMLKKNGAPKVVVYDLARCDMSAAVADAFRYSKLVLATTTYNADIFPFMRTFIEHLTERFYQRRTVGLIENGTWSPQAANVMKSMFAESPRITICKNVVHIASAVDDTSEQQMEKLSAEICRDYIALDNDLAKKDDINALFKIGYGLYVVTCNDGTKDNGLIVNTVTQVTNTPNRVAVLINKMNYSHDVIKNSGILNVNVLSVEAPFKVFQQFGFQSGKDVDKFAGLKTLRSDNGLVILPRYINSVLSLKVEQYVDMDTHGMFICTIEEARIMSNAETMNYNYYQDHVKPHWDTEGKTGWVCKVCGYIYEGEELPPDFVCPLCKHGAADFMKIG